MSKAIAEELQGERIERRALLLSSTEATESQRKVPTTGSCWQDR